MVAAPATGFFSAVIFYSLCHLVSISGSSLFFWALFPVSCTVSEPRKTYWGENRLPLILQNAHRYFLYLAIAFVFFLSYDAWKGFWFANDLTGEQEFGMGVGSLVILTNAILLGGYTFGCHSFRHLVGGISNRLSKNPVRFHLYNCSSCLNKRHMNWAWFSLFWVAFSDFYVRMCSMRILTDWRIF